MDKIFQPAKGQCFASPLVGADYVDEGIFQREKKKVFFRSWVFAASAEVLSKEGDYVLLNLYDESIIVGRYDGKIRAFENRCPHRSSPIHCHEQGQRPLHCPFHGWTFDGTGAVKGVPQNGSLFGFDEAARKKLALKSYEVAQAGDFVFVRMPGARDTLQDFLGTMHEILTSVSAQWTVAGPWESTEIASNWKLIAEVALDTYHTAEVHPVSLGVNGIAELEYHHFTRTPRGHQVMTVGNSPQVRQMSSAVTIFFIFPNLVVVRLDEKFCNALALMPLRTNLTQLRSFTWLRRDQQLSVSSQRSLWRGFLATNQEDQRICESVQAGVRHHRRGQPLGATEYGIYLFQREWARRMKTWMPGPDFRFRFSRRERS